MNKPVNFFTLLFVLLLMNIPVIYSMENACNTTHKKSYKASVVKIITGTALLIISPYMLFNGVARLLLAEDLYSQFLTYGSPASFGIGCLLIKDGIYNYKQIKKENSHKKREEVRTECCSRSINVLEKNHND